MHISGNLSDDTGRIISGVPLQIWFDDELLGLSSDGVYIDDVIVHGTGYFEPFDYPGNRGWSVYSSPDSIADYQWEHGIPEIDKGPYVAHSGMRLWGTVLDGDYQRGALSFLVSPPMDMSVDRSYTLSFWTWWSLYWEADLAYVMTSTDGGSTWDEDHSMMFTEGGLQSDGWTLCEYNVTKCQGSSDVRFAFVFHSDDNTLVSRTDSSFDLTHHLPNRTTAGRHELIVRFEGNLLFQEGLLEQGIDVKRILHFEFEQNASRKVCHRNEPIELVVRLIDNEGEVIANNIDGVSYYYQVNVYWGRTPGIGERINGPRMYLDPETGRFSVLYTVHPEHDLGPVNVTFRFGGNDIYTPVQQTDVYFVKARVYIKLPDDEDFRRHRGQSVNIRAELRIVPSQSIIDKVLGDLVPDKYIKIYWDGYLISNRQTSFDGSFKTDYLVPSTHRLGKVLVSFLYEGSSLYDPVTRYVNYTIGSSTFIHIEDATAAKGEWITISGSVVDDRGEPAPNVQIHIIWKRAPEIGRATTRADGTFSLQYFVQYGDRRGNVTVIARFDGDMIYSASEANATWTIKAITNLERRDHTNSVLLGEQVILSAKLYERWDGYRGIEIPNEIVVLTIDGIVVASKATSYDGSVAFTVMFDPAVYSYGERSIVLRFGGSKFYSGSTVTFTIIIRFQGHVTFSEFYINGQTVNPWKDIMGKGDTITGRIRVVDDDGSPISGKKVKVHYYEDLYGGGWVDIAEGRTDSEGYFWFATVIRAQREGILTFIAECEVLTAEEYPRISVTYIVPPPPTDAPIVRTTGSRLTEVGERLTLEVMVRDARYWNTEDLVFRLVSPPEGMTISSDGTITWTPRADQVGTFEITVWVSDGLRSETTVLTITVSEKSDSYGNYGWVAAFIVVILLMAGIVTIHYRRRG